MNIFNSLCNRFFCVSTIHILNGKLNHWFFRDWFTRYVSSFPYRCVICKPIPHPRKSPAPPKPPSPGTKLQLDSHLTNYFDPSAATAIQTTIHSLPSLPSPTTNTNVTPPRNRSPLRSPRPTVRVLWRWRCSPLTRKPKPLVPDSSPTYCRRGSQGGFNRAPVNPPANMEFLRGIYAFMQVSRSSVSVIQPFCQTVLIVNIKTQTRPPYPPSNQTKQKKQTKYEKQSHAHNHSATVCVRVCVCVWHVVWYVVHQSVIVMRLWHAQRKMVNFTMHFSIYLEVNQSNQQKQPIP